MPPNAHVFGTGRAAALRARARGGPAAKSSSRRPGRSSPPVEAGEQALGRQDAGSGRQAPLLASLSVVMCCGHLCRVRCAAGVCRVVVVFLVMWWFPSPWGVWCAESCAEQSGDRGRCAAPARGLPALRATAPGGASRSTARSFGGRADAGCAAVLAMRVHTQPRLPPCCIRRRWPRPVRLFFRASSWSGVMGHGSVDGSIPSHPMAILAFYLMHDAKYPWATYASALHTRTGKWLP